LASYSVRSIFCSFPTMFSARRQLAKIDMKINNFCNSTELTPIVRTSRKIQAEGNKDHKTDAITERSNTRKEIER